MNDSQKFCVQGDNFKSRKSNNKVYGILTKFALLTVLTVEILVRSGISNINCTYYK